MPDLFDIALCGVLASENFPCVALRDGASWLVPCVLDLDEGEATISPIAPLPKDSWIEMYTDNSGWDFFGEDEYNAWRLDDLGWCIRRGIAPDQRFYVLVSVESSQSGMYGDDYDEAWDAQLVWAENLSQREHANRIEEMLIGWWIQDKKHDDHASAWKARVARAPKYLRVYHAPTRRQETTVSLMSTAIKPCECCRLDDVLATRTCDNMNGVPDLIVANRWEDLPMLVALKANVLALGRLLCPGGGRDEIQRVGEIVKNIGTLYSPLLELQRELKFANSVRRLDVY